MIARKSNHWSVNVDVVVVVVSCCNTLLFLPNGKNTRMHFALYLLGNWITMELAPWNNICLENWRRPIFRKLMTTFWVTSEFLENLIKFSGTNDHIFCNWLLKYIIWKTKHNFRELITTFWITDYWNTLFEKLKPIFGNQWPLFG